MGFDVNNCGLDPGRLKDLFRLAQADVGQSDGLALALVDQALDALHVSSSVTPLS